MVRLRRKESSLSFVCLRECKARRKVSESGEKLKD